MGLRIEFEDKAKKDLAALDRMVAKRIVSFLRERVAVLDDPRSIGEALHGDLGEFWRYRVGDYRIMCRIEDVVLLVQVVRIGHRREVYR